MPHPSSPSPTLDPTTLLNCKQIAERIAATRGHCDPASVWRMCLRLKLIPALTKPWKPGVARYYSPAQADQIAAAMRGANLANLADS